MSAELKNIHINTHIVDVLGSVKGRDQPVMKMDKAVELVKELDEEVFINEDYVFFDPFCKAGEILLATALVSIFYKSKRNLASLDSVYRELYQSNRYFALAPDERHYNLSLRTFYGNEKSHDKNFICNIKNGGYLSEDDGRLNKKQFNRRLKIMLEYIKEKTGNKKIVAVGNPPYQENYEGNNSNTGANPIYHFLLDSLIESKKVNQYVMVIPSRWFSGGRGQSLRQFAKKLRKSRQIKKICDFENSKEIFPTVEIKGGVCFLHWSEYHKGKTLFYSLKNNEKSVLDLSKGNIIVRNSLSRSIVEKVHKKSSNYISEIAWSWNPFGLSSNHFDKNSECSFGDLLDCFTKRKIKKKIRTSKIIKNRDQIQLYKVVVPKAVKKGGIPYSKDQLFILNPKQICTESYMVIDTFRSKNSASKFLSYLNTNFVRFLISVKKITQDITKDTWSLVPDLSRDTHKDWTDAKVFKHFNLTKEEQEHIMNQEKNW